MDNKKFSVHARSIVLIAVLGVVVAISLGVILSRFTGEAMREQVQERMMDVASSAAALLDGDSLETLTAADQNTPEYAEAMSTLEAFQDSVALSYIYCVRELPDGTFEFTVDPTKDDPAAFGEQARTTNALKEAAAGHAAVDFVAYEDRWGRFYSAYCPVFTSRGTVAGVVAVDYAASWFDERVAEMNRIIVVNTASMLIVAVLAICMARWLTQAESSHTRSLVQANRYDALTGLAKMSYFFEVAKGVCKRVAKDGDEPAILYIDLAGMKYFNQTYGFSGGDKLLKAIADLLAAYFGSTFCGRLGQDHFAVVTGMRNLDALLDALIIDAVHVNNSKSLPLRIGVYPTSMEDVEISVACDRAKIASFEGAIPYRSTYSIFDRAMLARDEKRRYIIDNIDRAIENGWIHVYYQPIVRAENGCVCDEESLARWVDPTHGFLSPADFIPALEDAKLIYKLDLNVLEQTLRKMRHLSDVGLYVVPSSINLSRSDFEVCDIVEEVRRRVDESGFGRDMVNIEITESAMGRDFAFMKQQVERFHDLGFRVWMDDFGSEYSSLDYLQNLTFDLIKLDMRFMRQFNENEKSRVILTELVKMAIGLGVETICEGVEEFEQVEFLREVGCNKLQGFYFTKPLPLEDVLERYESGTAIGFENPAESEYYSALGRVNLYDPASIVRDQAEGLHQYFNTLPMAILETTETEFAVIRCNSSYRSFLANCIGEVPVGTRLPYVWDDRIEAQSFLGAVRECGLQGGLRVIDGTMPQGLTTHAFARCIAINPVTGTAAVAVAILSVG